MNPVAIIVVACLASSHAGLVSLPVLGGVVPFSAQPQSFFSFAPAFTSTQYHAQDEFGQASFGYAHAGQAASNQRDAFGNQVGSWSYVDPNGKLVVVNYVADANGFRVLSNNLPESPAAPAPALPVAPLPVQETTEVAAARAAHLAAVAEVKARNAALGPSRRRRDIRTLAFPFTQLRTVHEIPAFAFAHAAPAQLFHSAFPVAHAAAPVAHAAPAVSVVHSVAPAPVAHSIAALPVAHSAFHVAPAPVEVAHTAVPVAAAASVPAFHTITPVAHAAVAPVVHAVAPVAVGAPAPSVTKYHSQDELGQASFGHATHDQTHNAVRDAFGNQVGSYRYINPEGKEVVVHYTAGVGGFRVLSNALPQAAAPGVEVAPSLVKDNDDVIAARAAHFKAFEEARDRIKHN